jgi:hypothetical protein
MIKRIISSLIVFIFSTNLVFGGDVIQGYIEKNTEPQHQSELYTGEIQFIEKKKTIKMTVSQVIDGSFSMEGDEFFAEITEDLEGGHGIIFPAGSVAHGKINQATAAKRLGRNGWVDLSFDYIVTPDGTTIPIEGKISTKDNPLVQTGKIIATDIGYTAAGGVAGGLVALQLFGIEAAIASQGYTLAGGAAVGGAIGLGASLYRKGKTVLIKPGDEIKVKVTSNVPLQVYKNTAFLQEELKYEGLDVVISDIKYEKDPFGQLNTITLTTSLTNKTPLTFSSFDVMLENEYNAKFPPSIFGKTNLLFKQIKPGDSVSGDISFSVDNIKRNYFLVFYDRRSRKPVAKISIKNAYRNVSQKTKKRNSKKFEKNKYYKDDKLDIDL